MSPVWSSATAPAHRSAALRRDVRMLLATAAAGGTIGAAMPARADDNPVFLQWFETRWTTMERRMPDFFMAGYDGTWLPPPAKAADPSSPGYDPFDRFDLGSPGSPTLYGTEARMRAVIAR
jgi:alpha-amylase